MFIKCPETPLVPDIRLDPLPVAFFALLIGLTLLIPLFRAPRCPTVLAAHEEISVLLIYGVVGEVRALLVQVREAEGLGGETD